MKKYFILSLLLILGLILSFQVNAKEFLYRTYYGQIYKIKSEIEPSQDIIRKIYKKLNLSEESDTNDSIPDWVITKINDKKYNELKNKTEIKCKVNSSYYDETMGTQNLIYYIDNKNKKLLYEDGEPYKADYLVFNNSRIIFQYKIGEPSTQIFSTTSINLKTGDYESISKGLNGYSFDDETIGICHIGKRNINYETFDSDGNKLIE